MDDALEKKIQDFALHERARIAVGLSDVLLRFGDGETDVQEATEMFFYHLQVGEHLASGDGEK